MNNSADDDQHQRPVDPARRSRLQRQSGSDQPAEHRADHGSRIGSVSFGPNLTDSSTGSDNSEPVDASVLAKARPTPAITRTTTSAFDAGNGDCVAFFWFADAPDGQTGETTPAALPGLGDIVTAVGSMNHLAFHVPPERFDEYRQRLTPPTATVGLSGEPSETRQMPPSRNCHP